LAASWWLHLPVLGVSNTILAEGCAALLIVFLFRSFFDEA